MSTCVWLNPEKSSMVCVGESWEDERDKHWFTCNAADERTRIALGTSYRTKRDMWDRKNGEPAIVTFDELLAHYWK